MPKYDAEEIKSRTKLSQKMFRQIEGLVLDFLDYVPLDNAHLTVYSLKLIPIILEIGPEMFNSFDLAVAKTRIYAMHEWTDRELKADREKLWEKEEQLRKKKRSLTFHDYYCFLNTHGTSKLGNAVVQLKDFDSYIVPFESSNPEWWEGYNELRHDKYNNLKTATLKTALTSLGALFWLIDYNSSYFASARPFDSAIFLAIEQYKVDHSRKKL